MIFKFSDDGKNTMSCVKKWPLLAKIIWIYSLHICEYSTK